MIDHEPLPLGRVITRLEAHLPTDLLKPFSPAYLAKTKPISYQERARIAQIDRLSSGFDQAQTLDQFLEQQKKGKEQGVTDETDLNTLSFLISRFSTATGMAPYDEQKTALLRAVECYRSPGTRGEVLQMLTSEGKSSVVIPILIAYLYSKGETVHIHSVTPFLRNEGFEMFQKYAATLGMEEDIACMQDISQRNKLGKKIVFGLWSDFIHSYQLGFINTLGVLNEGNGSKPESFFPKQPVMIIDEIDPILRDEQVTEAIISGEKITWENFYDGIAQDFKENQEQALALHQEKSSAGGYEFVYRKKGSQPIVKEMTRDAVAEMLPENSENFAQIAKVSLSIIERLIDDYVQKGAIRRGNFQETAEALSELLPITLFKTFIARGQGHVEKKIAEWTDEEHVMVEEAYAKSDHMFWWELPYVEQALIGAAILRRGIDYEVKDHDTALFGSSDAVVWLRQTMVLPKAKTGYMDADKQYMGLVQGLLNIKEGLALPAIINSPEDSDRMKVGDYYTHAQGRIFGFTGTAEEVAESLHRSYDLETTLIPEKKPTRRSEKFKIAADADTKIKLAIDEVNNTGKNTIFVVDSQAEADNLKGLLGEGNETCEVRYLSAQNEDEDSELYEWVSDKIDRKRVLVMVRMIGRGVDLKPADGSIVKKEGFKLVSTTPFELNRSYRQLIGRVGRRGETGETVTFLSPDDYIYSLLKKDEKKELEQAFAGAFYHNKAQQPSEPQLVELRQKALERAIHYRDICRQRFEEKIGRAAYQDRVFSAPIMYLRQWLMGDVIQIPGFSQLENSISRQQLAKNWPDFITSMEEKYNACLAAGTFGPFAKGDMRAIWQEMVIDEVKKIQSLVNGKNAAQVISEDKVTL